MVALINLASLPEDLAKDRHIREARLVTLRR